MKEGGPKETKDDEKSLTKRDQDMQLNVEDLADCFR